MYTNTYTITLCVQFMHEGIFVYFTHTHTHAHTSWGLHILKYQQILWKTTLYSLIAVNNFHHVTKLLIRIVFIIRIGQAQ